MWLWYVNPARMRCKQKYSHEEISRDERIKALKSISRQKYQTTANNTTRHQRVSIKWCSENMKTHLNAFLRRELSSDDIGVGFYGGIHVAVKLVSVCVPARIKILSITSVAAFANGGGEEALVNGEARGGAISVNNGAPKL